MMHFYTYVLSKYLNSRDKCNQSWDDFHHEKVIQTFFQELNAAINVDAIFMFGLVDSIFRFSVKVINVVNT